MNQRSGKQPQPDEWISAQDACVLLDVKRQTLYAYVSRGHVRSRGGAGGRQHLYARDDVTRLKARSRARAGHGAVAAGAMRWGEPVLDSAITKITPKGHLYRGEAALDLAARGVSFEAVAERLWTTHQEAPAAGAAPAPWAAPKRGAFSARAVAALLPSGSRPLDALALVVAVMAPRDPTRFAPSEGGWRESARLLIRYLAAGAGLGAGGAHFSAALQCDDIAASLLAAFRGTAKRERRAAVVAVNEALLLVADHELNSSSFAGRVAASTGADIYACVAAALAALSGPRHGALSERVRAMAVDTRLPERAPRAIAERLGRGEEVPGFGHPLYPDGDPRAVRLLQLATQLGPQVTSVRTLHALSESMALAGGEPPNLDVGLVAVCEALRLPAGAASALFAVGRAAGWVAHAMEQRRSGLALRPRARYVGE